MTAVFATEWVQLQTIAAKQPDPTMFPMVNDALKQSMVQQTTTFFQDLLTNGGPFMMAHTRPAQRNAVFSLQAVVSNATGFLGNLATSPITILGSPSRGTIQ